MKKTIIFCILLLVLTGCAGSFNNSGMVTQSNFQLDTIVTINLYGEIDEAIFAEAFAEIDRLEKLLSRKFPGSDLDRLAKSSGKSFVPVSPDTILLFKIAGRYSKLTDGLFDVTIGPLVSLWDITGGGYFPSDAERMYAMALVNYEDVLIGENDEAMLKVSGMEADFGAIAKGYIADKVKALLIEKGVASGIVNLGGDVVLIGGKPDGGNFNIGVQDPRGQKGKSMGVLEISDKSLVSSGTYERYFEYGGETYHHILNPKTGFPASNELLQITVIADDAMTGDVISTSAFLLGLEKGMALINNTPGVSAIFVTNDKKVYLSNGFNEIFRILDDDYSLEGELM